MPTLIFTGADGQRIELPLREGLNRVGRVDGNDILVPDESVAESHCEVTVSSGQISVRDLGTTSGTAVNGAFVREGPLLPGETLRVGNVEFALLDDGPPIGAPRLNASAPQSQVSGEVCWSHPTLPAKWRCSKCGDLACDTCVVDGRSLGVPGVKFCRSCKSHTQRLDDPSVDGRRSAAGKTFGGEMLAAWAYPLRRDGLMIINAGAIFYAIAGYGQRMLLGIGLLIYVLTTGYWMAYAQQVVQTSAQGQDDPPTWPDFSNFIDDIILPFIQAAGLTILYLLPALLAWIFLDKDQLITYLIALALLLVALFMMPMAWLAISMHESILGLSPHFVLPSILRIPGQYMLIFVEVVILVAINVGLEFVLELMPIPFIGPLISSFLSVYFMMVLCRLLGSLYFLNRKRLNWF
jgi:hypothetical protein